MSTKYLQAPFTAVCTAERAPRYGWCRDGYTRRSGAPTRYLVRLAGEKRYRRVMVWIFSNSGTMFVRVRGECLILGPEHTSALDGQRMLADAI